MAAKGIAEATFCRKHGENVASLVQYDIARIGASRVETHSMAVQAPSEARKRPQKRSRGHKRRPWLRRLGYVLLFLICAVAITTVAYRFVNPPITAVMLQDKIFQGKTLKRRWVPLSDISPNLRLAVVASEDGNFCSHWGVDWGAVREAVEQAKSWKGVRGASTIPMQVARNLFLWEQRNYLRKALEVPLSYFATAVWSKKRMLEIYVNIAQWGPGLFGAEAASRYYFGKPASALTTREAALLAAALPNPFARNPAKPSGRMRLVADTIQRRMPIIAKRADCVLKR